VSPPSASVVESAPTSVPWAVFSSTSVLSSAMSVGVAFGLAVNVKDFENVPPAPSFVWMRTL
jgi:hypothetical protein